MIIQKTGVTSRKHEALRVLLDADFEGLKLMASSDLWVQVDRELDEDEVSAILAIDVSALDEEAIPLTPSQILAQLQLEFALQAEIMSEMMEILSVL